jgi:predicted Rdx family selenoprotein
VALWIGGEIYAAGGSKIALKLTPGAAGIFEVKLDGKVVFDKGTLNKFPDLNDAKEIKATVINQLA